MAKCGVLIEDEHVEEQFAWYEASLPLMERKKRGHFSTPLALVDQILDACGYIVGADLAQIRVLDPACGSCHFLAGGALRLLAFGERTGLSPQERIALVQRNLWGFDPDPISCFLAETQILNHMGGQLITTPVEVGPSRGRNTLHPYTKDARLTPSLHIHQADTLPMPWEPSVDLLFAILPYLAPKINVPTANRAAHGRVQP